MDTTSPMDELFVRAQQMQESPQALLACLGDMGFSWRSIADMLRVSVPIVRQWRHRSTTPSETHRHELAVLVAGIDMLTSQTGIQDIASWLETPLIPGVPVTPVELWSAEPLIVLHLASASLTPEEVLDAYEPEWRTKWNSDFVVFRNPDGHMSIARKS